MALKHRNSRKSFKVLNRILIIFSLTTLIFLNLFEHEVSREKNMINKKVSEHSCLYNETVKRYFEKRQYWVTSNLGSILFKNEPMKYNQQNRTFTVLIWKHPYWTRTIIRNSLNVCSVKNCIFSVNNNLIKVVDVVVVSTYKGQIPWVHKRNASQRWVLVNNESPINSFSGSVEKINISEKIKSMANIFNWSMTYRSDSDVPTPYGRTVSLPEILIQRISSYPTTKLIPNWDSKQRDILVVALISHCTPERMRYVTELQHYVKVDLFGKCAETIEMKKSCPGSASTDCPKIKNYLFYLAFENSSCRQYLTEKVFYNSFAKGAIPIVMGAPVSDCEKLLPPYSFLHVNSFDSPRHLAMEILHLSTNDGYLEMYHKWRHYFKVINEDGYFGNESYALCRLCEALNYNDNKTKVYDLDALKLYLDPKLLCTIPVKH